MNEEKHTLYFELLYFLANQGLGVDTNIRDLCNKYVDKDHDSKEIGDAFDAFSKSWTRVMAVLGKIKNAGYIEYTKDHNDLQQLYIVDGNFSASITKEGLDYYYSDLLRKATIGSLKRQFGYNLTTWILAVVAIVVSGYSIIQKDEISTETTHLQQEIQQMKVPLHSQAATHNNQDTIYQKK
jgi:hypothetical protein